MSVLRNISSSVLATSVVAELDVLIIAQVPVINALILSNLCE